MNTKKYIKPAATLFPVVFESTICAASDKANTEGFDVTDGGGWDY